MLSGFVASGMITFDTTLHAAGPDGGSAPGFCKVLAAGIDTATGLGLDDLAAYLQSVYDTYCS
jgi:hypothetical protein